MHRLTGLISDEWLPSNILETFRSNFLELLRSIDYPYYANWPSENNRDNITQQTGYLVETIRKQLINKLDSNIHLNASKQYRRILIMFSNLMSILAGLSLPSEFWHSKTSGDITELLAGFLSIEFNHWISRNVKKKSAKYSIQHFPRSRSQ